MNPNFRKLNELFADCEEVTASTKFALALLRDGKAPQSRSIADGLPGLKQIAVDDTKWAYKMSQSQLHAFDRVVTCNTGMSLVWGPPGTGKTHWVASTMLYMMIAAQVAGKPFRVLVTAQNHHAIQTTLRSFSKLRASRPEDPDNSVVSLMKISRQDNTDSTSIGPDCLSITSQKELRNALRKLTGAKSMVLGSTVWNLRKYAEFANRSVTFDVIVVDEASQMPTTEAFLALMQVSANPGCQVILVSSLATGFFTPVCLRSVMCCRRRKRSRQRRAVSVKQEALL